MNVTLKLPDELCKAARHRAVDESKSLSAWVADLLRRELGNTEAGEEKPKSWMELLSEPEFDDEFCKKEFPLEDRKAGKVREFSLYD